MEDNNLIEIRRLYEESVQVQEVVDVLNEKANRELTIKGLSGGMSSFFTAALGNRFHRLVCLLPEKEQAAYFYSTLESIAPDQALGFLPDSFKLPGVFTGFKRSQLKDRTEVISRLTGEKGSFILITYPEAIFEKVMAPSAINKREIKCAKGESVDLDFLIEILIEYGFTRVDFVSEPGEFSIRGGIIDLFSYSGEWPYRIELFGDEVESIRAFNPLDQLSIKELSWVSVIPNLDTEVYQADRCSLLELLPEKTAIILEDETQIVDRVQMCFENAQQFLEEISTSESEEESKDYLKGKPWILTRELVDGLKSYRKIWLRTPPDRYSNEIIVSFNGRPQPNFNKNFSLFIDDLREKDRLRIKCYLFTDNPRQYNRIVAILDDLEAGVKLHPVMRAIDRGFIDNDLKIACYTDHEIFRRFHKYRIKKGFTKDQAIQLRMLKELTPGDYVTHMDHGIGRYSGLEKINISGHIQESVRLIYKNNDILYVSIHSLHKITKYIGKDDSPPKLNKLGTDTWARTKAKTKKKIKDIAGKLIRLYSKRKEVKGVAFPEDGYLQNELEASFIYEDTPDQVTATEDVKRDMQKPVPMDRLICGDVGFGKTEVAIRAVFKAVLGGKQVAVLVPTTILALQHYSTFNERLSGFGLTIDYVNRFKTAAQKRRIFEKLKAGKTDVIIGTHSLLNKNVEFKDLGLLVVDEEQKFGVTAKEKLRAMKVDVDTLTLTATPIPRTLQFSLMGARDMSVLRTPPPNRQPIHTEVRTHNVEVIKNAIYYEIDRGGQVFFVHNRVKNLPDIHQMLKRLCPDVSFFIAHGQMESNKLETTLVDFIEGKADVLLCTNIIETGLDITNVNTIIINNAHHFGLSDLHQLRGRVGRSNIKAYCYLITPPYSTLTPDARKRLKTIEEFTDLGSGIHIAMRDLDIRGAGSLLGAEQSGFISDIGFDAYQKILEEAIVELKEGEFKDLFDEKEEEKGVEKKYVRDVELDIDVEMLIPDDYIRNTQERLKLYKELDELNSGKELLEFEKKLKDRFGSIPGEVYNLFDAFRIRWACKKLGIERLTLKGTTMKCFFPSNPRSAYYQSRVFGAIMQYVAENGRKYNMYLKQSKDNLILTRKNLGGLQDLKEAISKFEKIAKVKQDD